VSDFESLRNAVIQEVNTALTGSSTASDFRIRLEMENLKSGMTVRQQMASIDNLMSALEARKDAAYAVPYPWEVVRGETTMEQWKQKQAVQKGVPGGGMNFDPNAINAELKRRGVIK
jgi:hypothetical protein